MSEYELKLGEIQTKIQSERDKIEKEQVSFKVPQSLVGLIIGK
jgi:hypothetical protein